MRLFISIKIPEDIRGEILKLERELKGSLNCGRWNKNLHITLSFLGEVSEEKVPAIIAIMKEAAKGGPPFQIFLRGVGSFPNRKTSKILWLGATEGSEEAAKLYRAISSDLGRIVGRDNEDDAFIPHITLGRFSPPLKGKRFKEVFEKFGDVSLSSFSVDRIYLTKSELNQKGAIHTDIGEVLLG